MGCEKSVPVNIASSKLDQPTLICDHSRTHVMSNRIISRLGSITEYFRILRALTTTNLGNLLYAEDLQSNNFRAVREISKSTFSSHKEVFKEMSILSELDHPNIVKIYETIETKINYYVVYEYLDGGDLSSRIKRTGNEVKVSKYMHEIVSALIYIHLQGVIHCNLSPESIMFTSAEESGIPKLINFFSSQWAADVEAVDPRKLSYIYMSPDILNKKITEKTDMWSIGIITYKLLVGKHPYLSKDKRDILKEIFRGEVDFNNQAFLALTVNAQDFIKKLLDPNPETRASAKDIINHPWLQSGSSEFYLNFEVIQKLRTFKVKAI